MRNNNGSTSPLQKQRTKKGTIKIQIDEKTGTSNSEIKAFLGLGLDH